jgi:hypothetical protein
MKTRLCAIVTILLFSLMGAAAIAQTLPPADTDETFLITFKAEGRPVGKTVPFTFVLSDSTGEALWQETASYRIPVGRTITHLLGSVHEFNDGDLDNVGWIGPVVDFSKELTLTITSGPFQDRRLLARMTPYAEWSTAAAELKGGGYTALRVTAYDPAASPDDPAAVSKIYSPNIIGGHRDNAAANPDSSTAVVGAVIGGGGAVSSPNAVYSNFSTVGGGRGNSAGELGWEATNHCYATVGGGHENTAHSYASVVAGGDSNLISWGYGAAIGGGVFNVVDGPLAAIPGGEGNYATGSHSLAAGYAAYAVNNSAFVWNDNTPSYATGLQAPFRSTSDNQFAVRATGGVLFVTAADAGGNPARGFMLGPGSGLTVVTSFSCDSETPPACVPATGWYLDLTADPPAFRPF